MTDDIIDGSTSQGAPYMSDISEEIAVEQVFREKRISYTRPEVLGEPYHTRRVDYYYDIEGLGRRGLEVKNRNPNSIQSEEEAERDFVKESHYPTDYWGSYKLSKPAEILVLSRASPGSVLHEPTGFKYETNPEAWKEAFRHFLHALEHGLTSNTPIIGASASPVGVNGLETRNPGPSSNGVGKILEEPSSKNVRNDESLGIALGSFGNVISPERESIVQLPVDKIRNSPFQARKDFSEIENLEESIKHLGLDNPILVRPLGDGEFELVAGERRLRAFRKLGRSAIPAIVRQLTDEEAAVHSFAENYQRKNLKWNEEGEGYDKILARFPNLSERKLAELVGKKQKYVQERVVNLRFLKSTGRENSNLGLRKATKLRMGLPSEQERPTIHNIQFPAEISIVLERIPRSERDSLVTRGTRLVLVEEGLLKELE
jgi:ParB/RepB/Spo0J family partition protein